MTVETDHHYGLRCDLESFAVIDEIDKLLVDDVDDMVLRCPVGGWFLFECSLLDLLREFQYELDVDIRLE